MKGDLILTFDIDWVADSLLQELVEFLKAHSVPATFFATHQSPVVDEIKSSDLFQLGSHPNFFPGSSQGKSEDEVFDFFNNYFPESQWVRTHGVFQYGSLYGKFVNKWGTRFDSSLFAPMQWQYTPFHFQTPFGNLIRAPFTFADDYLFGEWKPIIKNVEDHYDHPIVIMFHPIHWALNTPNSHYYESVKGDLHQLNSGTSADFADLRNSKDLGCRDIFDLILQNKTGEFKFFDDLSEFVSSK